MGIQLVNSFQNEVNTVLNSEDTIKGWWRKVFYVDAVNGDDTNDGSSTAPLATPDEAIRRVPNGGSAMIVLVTDVTMNTPHFKDNVDIVFTCAELDYSDSTNWRTISLGIGKAIKILYGQNNRLHFAGIKLDFDLNGLSSTVDLISWSTNFFKAEADGVAKSVVSMYYGEIDITTDADYDVFLVSYHWGLKLQNVTINYNNSTGNDYFYLGRIVGAMQLIVGNNIININGTSYGITDVIANGKLLGIVRDANGVPRNLLINTVV